MKSTVLLAFLFSCVTFFNSTAQTLRAELALARFNSPTDGPYLETYLKLKGNSLKMIESEDGYFSEVVLRYKVLKNDDVVFEDSFILNGPIIKDSVPQDFIDIQRIPLEKGDYQLNISMRDKQSPEVQTVDVKQDIRIDKTIDFSATIGANSAPVFDPATGQTTPGVNNGGGLTQSINYYVSDFQLIDSYAKSEQSNMLTKNGFDLIPYTSNYYPESRSEITIYAEVYNTNQRTLKQKRALGNLFKDKSSQSQYLINLAIETADDGRVVENLRSYVKLDSASVVPVLHSFPLDKVPTGNYNFVIELRDAENNLLERKLMFFQRNNPMETEYVMPTDLSEKEEIDLTFVGKYNRPEELEEYLRCLHPISSQEEIQQVNRKMNFNDVDMMQRFMYNFWKLRDPENPEEAWLKYWKEVEKVNAAYSTNLMKGYDTDRGRVYLQYGPPNTISPNYFEPNTYPYEIWHYYTLRDHLNADQSNRKFVFANTEQGSPEFDLIHSDAKNEITNVRWNYDLHKRSTSTIDLDQENTGDHYGGRSREFFDNPY